MQWRDCEKISRCNITLVYAFICKITFDLIIFLKKKVRVLAYWLLFSVWEIDTSLSHLKTWYNSITYKGHFFCADLMSLDLYSFSLCNGSRRVRLVIARLIMDFYYTYLYNSYSELHVNLWNCLYSICTNYDENMSGSRH